MYSQYPYAVARLNIENYIRENDALNYDSMIYVASSHSAGIADPRWQQQQQQGRKNQPIAAQLTKVRKLSLVTTKDTPLLISPEDHPCVTEANERVCGPRSSKLMHIHATHSAQVGQHLLSLKSSKRNLRRTAASKVSRERRSLRMKSWDGLFKPPNQHTSPDDGSVVGSGGSTSGSGGTAGASSFNYTAAPSSSPTPRPAWSVQWEWLPGFVGTNGPVFRMTEGVDYLRGTVLLVGAFYNYPAIIVWSEASARNSSTWNISSIPGSYALEGLLTTVVQAYLPFEPLVPPSPIPTPEPRKPNFNYTFLIVVGCVGMGIVLGLVFAIGCLSRQGFQYAWLPGSFGPDYKEEGPGGGMLGAGLSLTTLSGGAPGALADFKLCYERAMASRHLPIHDTLLIINPKEIVLSCVIGEGSFGRVWSGRWRNNVVAVKEFVFAQAAIEGGSLQRNSIIEEIVGEAGVMTCLRHPKILQLYGCSLTMQAIWLVSELCLKGSLRMLLSSKSIDLPLIKKLSICMDIADAMHYLHSRTPPVIHRDLKTHNIFITEVSPGHLVAKIGDWGSARAVAMSGSKSMTQGVGTACWLSPEVINFSHFSKHSDVYAFGIILWEIFTRQDVYVGLSAAQIIAKVAHEGLRPLVPADCAWESIMTSCWQEDPDDRPTFHQVLVALSKIYSSVRDQQGDSQRSTSAGAAGAEETVESPLLFPSEMYEPLLDEYQGLKYVPTPTAGTEEEDISESPFDPDLAQLPLYHSQHSVTNSSPPSSAIPLRSPMGSGGSKPAIIGKLRLNIEPTMEMEARAQSQSQSDTQRQGCEEGQEQQRQQIPGIVVSPHAPTPRLFLPPSASAPSLIRLPTPTFTSSSSSLKDTSSPGLGTNSQSRTASNPNPNTSIYRNEVPLNFDVSDLTGPTYYIMEEDSDDGDTEADPLNFLFANRKGEGQSETYLGDKALKPHLPRKNSGSKLFGKSK